MTPRAPTTVLTLLRSDRAPAPRTLVEIFEATVEQHVNAPAVDNGAEVLTYGELSEAAEEVAAARTLTLPDAQIVEDLSALLTSAGER